MRVAVLHNEVLPTDGEDHRDVLIQAEAVTLALESLGCHPQRLACTLDLAEIRQWLREEQPDVVFNLVENLGGSDWLIHVIPSLLDVLGLPYTGCPTTSIFLSTQKLLAKRQFRDAGLPTPAWIERASNGDCVTLQVAPGTAPRRRASGRATPSGPVGGAEQREPEDRWILKTVCEHGSFALDANAICRLSPHKVHEKLVAMERRLGRPCFAESYIEGREFNISLLGGPDGPEVLPPAEIDFTHFPRGKPRIVGFTAKWQSDTPEYQRTPRRFAFGPKDARLLERLRELALACWQRFGLRGYARVDFRVDRRGQPYILEINSNPCLSPNAGFAASLEMAGIDFAQAVRRIVEDALGRAMPGVARVQQEVALEPACVPEAVA